MRPRRASTSAAVLVAASRASYGVMPRSHRADSSPTSAGCGVAHDPASVPATICRPASRAMAKLSRCATTARCALSAAYDGTPEPGPSAMVR